MEISGPTFQQVLAKLPDWLKILMKTIVGRLRAASTRIRQLESASSALDYSGDGKRSSHYVYLSTTDCLKVCTALLLVGTATAPRVPKALTFASACSNVTRTKSWEFRSRKSLRIVDILAQSGITAFGEGEQSGKFI